MLSLKVSYKRFQILIFSFILSAKKLTLVKSHKPHYMLL